MKHEELFIDTLNDLRSRLRRPTRYNYIKACGLLRQLMLDNPNLSTLANKRYNLKFKFPVNKTKLENDVFAQWVDIAYEKDGIIMINTNQFLACTVLTIFDLKIKVIDIINAAAHVQGGIHSYSVKKHTEKVASVLDSRIFQTQEFQMKSIKSICKVVLRAFRPLELLIKGRTPTGGF